MERNKRNARSIVTLMNRIIMQLENNGQCCTLQHYLSALSSFVRFRNHKDIMPNKIDQ